MEQKNILHPVEFHDIVLPTPEKAEIVYKETCSLFDNVVAGLRGDYFVKLLGNVVRVPSWFNVQPQL